MRLYEGPNRDIVMAGAAMMVAGAAFYIDSFAGSGAAGFFCMLFGVTYMFLGYFSKREAAP